MSDHDEKLFSRRRILTGGAAAGALMAAGVFLGCEGPKGEKGKAGKSGQDAADGTKVEWDEETDVVIAGCGGAGLVAAIEAAGAGAKVIVLEKSETPGGNTSYSGGVLQASGTKYQDDFGITGDNADKHYQYWIKAGEGSPDPDLVKLLADSSKADIEWLGGLGISYERIYAVDPIPYISPDLMLPRLHVAAGAGSAYTDLLKSVALAKGAEIRTKSEASSLVYDEDMGVLGVVALIGGARKKIKAKRAVILASGGYDRNEDMARAYSPQLLWDLQNGLCLASTANTGDGIRMGMDIGAALTGMGATISYPSIRIGRFEADLEIPGIWVNKYAQRFVNEATHYGYASRAIFMQEEHMVWVVFDDAVRQMGGSVIGGWSDDLSAEIASGTIMAAQTLAGLAAAIGVNVGQLPLTLQKWNDDMTGGGADTLFGKLVGLQPLNTPPYYATRVLCYNVGSCGGLKIDTDARVIGLSGDPVPGLYAAGMVAGGFIGPYYPGSGTAVTATVVFGRIAGRNAAAETVKS